MRAQLSYEFLLYTSIAALSIAAAIGLYLRGNVTLASYYAQGEMEAFVAGINANFAVQHGSFVAYMPKGACALTVDNGTLLYSGGSYPLPGGVIFLPGNWCAGGLALVNTEMLPNGTMQVS